MGLRHAKVFFSADVEFAFEFHGEFFISEASLARELIINVINVCQTHLGGTDSEKYSAMIQAVIETLPKKSALTMLDVENVIEQAKKNKVDSEDFLRKQSLSAKPETASTEDVHNNNKRERNANKNDVSSRRGVGEEGTDVQESLNNLERQVRNIESERDVEKSRRDIDEEAVLEEKIKRTAAKLEGHRQDDISINVGIFPSFKAGTDDTGSAPRSHSSLEKVQADTSLGGGFLLCDSKSSSDIKSGIWDTAFRDRLCQLRIVLGKATDVVRSSIPSLAPHLARVHHGHDSLDTYLGMFHPEGDQIVINLSPFMTRPVGSSRSEHALLHRFVIVLTHELAHMLEPKHGHGIHWYYTHMNMLSKVMEHYCSLGSEDLFEDCKRAASLSPRSSKRAKQS